MEVLESIKIFLSLNGIVYVLGISHDRVVELINKKYQTKNGEEYLKKFVQIPLTLTEWNEDEIENLIDDLLQNDIVHQDYRPIVEENKKLIALSIEKNPRELKRFLNNLIISYEVFSHVQPTKDESEKKNFLKQLLLVQIIKSNWKVIYAHIMDSEGRFLLKLNGYIPLDRTRVEKLSVDKSTDEQLKFIFENYKDDERLWTFFDKDNLNTLVEIPWKNFRRALKLTEEKLSTQRSNNIEYFDKFSIIVDEFKRITNELEEIGIGRDEETSLYKIKIDKMIQQLIESNLEMHASRDKSLLKDEMRMIPNYVEEFEKILTRIRIVKAGNKDRINMLIDKLTRLKIHAELSGIYDKY